MKILLNDNKEVCFKSIRYMIGEIIYGGRVTDPRDYTLLNAISDNYFNPEVLKDGYKFSTSGLYYSPEAGTV